MTTPFLHVAAFWCDGERDDEIATFCKSLKLEGTRGAVVTFSEETADSAAFRRTMQQLNLAEVNKVSP